MPAIGATKVSRGENLRDLGAQVPIRKNPGQLVENRCRAVDALPDESGQQLRFEQAGCYELVEAMTSPRRTSWTYWLSRP